MHPNPYENLLPQRTLSPAARTANATGVTVDRVASGGAYQDAIVVVATGTMTDGTHTIEVQDSPDGTTWTPVDDAYLQGTEPAIAATDDDKLFVIGYTGSQRYLRANVTTAGTTTGGVYGATVILTNGRRGPSVLS